MFNRKINELNTNNVKSTTNLRTYTNQINCVISSIVFQHLPDIRLQLIDLSKVLSLIGELLIVNLDNEDGSFHKV